MPLFSLRPRPIVCDPFLNYSSLINDQQISLKLLLTELFKTLIPHCLDILRQRTTDVDVKKYFVDCLEQVENTCVLCYQCNNVFVCLLIFWQIGSFAYTKVILKQMEDK